MIYGLDLLGLGSPHWNIQSTIRAWPQGWALGCFDGIWPHSFGDPLPHIRLMLMRGCVIHDLRVQMWWSYQHKVPPLELLARRLPRWQQFASRRPDLRVYLSPSCEYGDQTTKREVQEMFELTRRLAPSCIPVLTPETGKSGIPVIPGAIVEQHGIEARAKTGQLVSADGHSVVTDIARMPQWIKRNSLAEIIFGWDYCLSMKKDKFDKTVPDRRIISPSIQQIRQVVEKMVQH